MNNLYEILTNNVNGTTFISLTTETKVRLTGGKKNPQQGRVTKVTRNANVMVFQNKTTNGYENMVKRRLEQEGKDPQSFVLQPRKWGKRIEGTPFIEHKGKYYVEVIFLSPGKTEYYLDNKQVTRDQIIGLPERKEGQQGGLDNKVIIRTYAVDSIKSITVIHKTYDKLVFSVV